LISLVDIKAAYYTTRVLIGRRQTFVRFNYTMVPLTYTNIMNDISG